MRTYSVGEGRKKAARKFTTREGLRIALMITAAMIGMLILFLIGFFRIDFD